MIPKPLGGRPAFLFRAGSVSHDIGSARPHITLAGHGQHSVPRISEAHWRLSLKVTASRGQRARQDQRPVEVEIALLSALTAKQVRRSRGSSVILLLLAPPPLHKWWVICSGSPWHWLSAELLC